MKNKKKIYIGIIVILAIILTSVIGFNIFKSDKGEADSELLVARKYEQVEDGDEAIDGTEFVTFDAFYLRDLDGDGYAEKIRGTCKEIGTQDTLYMDLNVLTNGTLKDAKITINGKNFYFATALVKDSVIAQDYISTNLREVKLNDVKNGTQKLIFGMVQSGNYTIDSQKANAIGNDTNKYTVTDNTITLTGTHIADDGTETPIEKIVYLTNDWYGTTVAELNSKYETQEYNVADALDAENSTVNVKFKVNPIERQKQLIISNQHLELEVPELAGYKATAVLVDNSDAVVNYDAESGKVTIDLNANTVDGRVSKTISKDITYEITYVYPYEAYEKADKDGFTLNIPIDATYSGYNNLNDEFTSPYVSNVAEQVVSVLYGTPLGENAIVQVKVGEYSDGSYVVSKEKPLNIYNNMENESEEDLYTVRWEIYTGTEAINVPVIMNEPSTNYSDKFLDVNANYTEMLEYSDNIGIYFENQETLLGTDGYIKVYNNDTNELLHTFTKEDWSKYTKYNPYKYEIPVEHIRIETSNVLKTAKLYVYNIKQIDDIKLTADYTEEEFDKLSEIYSYLEGYMILEDGEVFKLDEASAYAKYQEPYSQAYIEISEDYISNQETKKGVIFNITTDSNEYVKKKWQNGQFLIKYPSEIIDVNINSVTSEDTSVTITGVDTYEENGNIYTRIYTSNDIPKDLNIEINADITADPRIETMTKTMDLYYYNENCSNYYTSSRTADIYDINNNENKEEYVGYASVSTNIIAPSTLLTSQTATDFDDIGSVIIAPQEATIDKADGTKTAKVNIDITNNYSNTISEVKIVGKIPFEGNTYQINGADMDSTFDTTMTAEGIIVPEELKQYTTIYYSYNEKVTEDINASRNGWTTTPEDMSKVKSFLIDLGDYVMPVDNTKTFSYTIQIPTGLDYNDVSYSAHAVYFCLDTNEGKLKTQTEPNKLGFRIAQKYDLEITKYETNSTKVIPGVVFSAQEVGVEETKTATTYSSGIATIKNLYVEREYVIKEIKTNSNYILDTTETRIIGHIIDGELQLEILEGGFKTAPVIEAIENANIKVEASLENEVKYNFVLNKTQTGTNDVIQGIRFELTDYNGKTKKYTTNANGQLAIKLLEPNVQYTLTETESKGHYLKDAVTFMMVRDENNNLKFNVLAGDLDTLPVIDQSGEVPVVTTGLQNEKIPTYSLRITKKETDTETTIGGAQFKLTGENKADNVLYTTDENGVIQIDNLYQYVEGKNVTGEYSLQEIYPTEGYILNDEPIVFKATKDATDNLTLELTSGTIRETIEDVVVDNTNPDNPIINITIDNDPVFTLTKVDAETGEPLEGVEFEITDLDGNTVVDANGNAIDKVYTDNNGKIRLSLTEGLYKATETKPLEGYAIPELYTGIGIGASKEAEYEYTYKWNNTENKFKIIDAILTEDKIIAVGTTKDIICCDYNGNVLWFINNNNNSKFYDYSAVVNVGDGFLAIGEDGIIDKYDFNGVKLWENKKFTSYNIFYAENISDGILLGMSGAIKKIDYSCNEIWSIDMSLGNTDIVEAASDGFYIYNNSVIKKYDYDRNIIWEKSLDYSPSAFQAIDDQLIAIGLYGIRKYDNQGNEILNIENSYVYGTEDITLVSDGVILATSQSNNFKIIKMDFEGNILWMNNELKNTYVKVLANEENIIAFSGCTVSGEQMTGIKGTITFMDLEGNILWNNNTHSELKHIQVETNEYGIFTVGTYGLLAKYDFEGNLEWFRRENNDISYQSLAFVSDGIAVADYSGNIYKYDYNGNFLGKTSQTTSISAAKIISIDDNIIIGGYHGEFQVRDSNGNLIFEKNMGSEYSFTSLEADGEYVILTCLSGNVLKVDLSGNVLWEISIGESYNNEFCSAVIEDGVIIGNRAGELFRYDNDGNEIWRIDTPASFDELLYVDGKIFASGGSAYQRWFDLNGKAVGELYMNPSVEKTAKTINEDILMLPDSQTGEVICYERNLIEPEIPSSQNIVIENEIIKYKITTKVDGYGGIISGMNEIPYEEVKYKNDSTKEIIATPANGYKVEYISINGQNINFVEEIDGSVKLNKFLAMTEDKEVIVAFANKTEALVLNKKDSLTLVPLANARFNIKQLEIRDVPSKEQIIGEIVANGEEYIEEIITLGDKVENVLGELTNNNSYYFVEENGTYVPNNIGVSNTTANSYLEIDLTNYVGTYAVVVNANISSESGYDIGYATINQSTSAPSYSISTGQFMKISGQTTAVTTPTDYIKSLEGGYIYYLHLGYRKDGSGNTGDDKVTINSIELYNATSEIKKNTYNFIENENGGFESNNKGVADTVANSYIPIDLTNYSGKYNLILNASISSDSSDIGYATITVDTSSPKYSNSSGRFIYISGTYTATKDYTAVLEGGNIYYLHLGYYKNSSTDKGDDKFVINSIDITLNTDDFVDEDIITNSSGEATIELSRDWKYQITEIEAPEGYTLNSTPIIYDFVSGQENIITVENDPQVDIIIHHYLKGTTTSVAPDETQKGDLGKEYITSPKTDLVDYQLVKNEDGSYQIPENASGIYTEETQVITYYYEVAPVQLIVHHYLDGTEDSVAPDVTSEAEKGSAYTTSPVEYPTLDEKYELVTTKLPENASGTLEDSVTEVTYYYKLKEYKITTEVDGVGGTITGEGQTPYETVLHGNNSVKDIVITPNTGYEIESITINGVEQTLPTDLTEVYTLDKFENVTEDKHIVVKFKIRNMTISISKNWIDDSNVNGKRPDEINVDVYDGSNKIVTTTLDKTMGAVPVSAEDNNMYMWLIETQIPMIDENGDLVNWDNLSFTESEINTNDLEFYTTTIEKGGFEENTATGYVYITNTFEVPDSKVDIQAIKNWSDNSNANSRRPSQIKLQLKNGDIVVQEQVLDVTTENSQSYTFTDLPEYDENGNTIEYTIDELEVNTDDLKFYTKVVNNETYTITNTFTVPEDKVNVDVTKKWEDSSNANNVRPTQITLQVKNGDEVVQEKTVDVTSDNEKVYTFENLAKYDANGQEIVYTADEKEVEGYIKTTDGTTVTNTIKLYKITTEVNGEGGTISGENENPYEEVTHGGTSVKDIIITPNEGYEISKITINDVEQTLPADSTVPYTMDKFENVTEDKHVIVEFKKREYKITTEVDGEGGAITGEGETPYETVIHGENSVKDIIVTPDAGYKITSITVNEQAIEFTQTEDDTYTLDKFVNMTEDKHVVVKFERKDTSIIVKHQTEDGTDLLEPETINGKVGDTYTTTEKDFEDYDIKTIPDNANGEMTEEQIEVIYVYSLVKGKITVTKVDINNTNTKLAGATFKLEKLDDDGNVDTTFASQEKTTESEGTVEFTDLLVGKYQITETKAPEGYELNTEVTEVEVTKANSELNVTVKNREKLTLPETGEINYTIMISGIGLAVMLVAVLIRKFKSTKVN